MLTIRGAAPPAAGRRARDGPGSCYCSRYRRITVAKDLVDVAAEAALVHEPALMPRPALVQRRSSAAPRQFLQFPTIFICIDAC
ncbi:hypothetical protein EVAR_56296_1 [Eumeta japonica]|uniref:Uncharacterized protein n=1 Tax=Eumeta variegata TaxID=151549 RepID=A0A4C1YZS0_EUMVA|nr:hypothetical protein EVAR_56296_1 [Eumeta japonica]